MEQSLTTGGVGIVLFMDELLWLTNHHRAPLPAIGQRPGRYIGCFENAYGEQLVFVHDDDQPDATLYLGDADWQPHRVSDAGGLPNLGELILNREEQSFLCACWTATAGRRSVRARPDAAARRRGS